MMRSDRQNRNIKRISSNSTKNRVSRSLGGESLKMSNLGPVSSIFYQTGGYSLMLGYYDFGAEVARHFAGLASGY